MTPTSTQSDQYIPRLSYPHQKAGGSQTESAKIMIKLIWSLFVFIQLIIV